MMWIHFGGHSRSQNPQATQRILSAFRHREEREIPGDALDSGALFRVFGRYKMPPSSDFFINKSHEGSSV